MAELKHYDDLDRCGHSVYVTLGFAVSYGCWTEGLDLKNPEHRANILGLVKDRIEAAGGLEVDDIDLLEVLETEDLYASSPDDHEPIEQPHGVVWAPYQGDA